MSVDLKCPNCGAIVGMASSDDNYKNHYFYLNKKSIPVCKNCDSINHVQVTSSLVILLTFLISLFYLLIV